MVMPNLIWAVLFGMAWCTPETTDFDVYHPHRHNYLVKTTLLGGGNFANKLSPGNLYVWMGVKPVESLRGEDKAAWTEKNPCTDLLLKPPEYIQYLPNESNKPDYLFTGEFGKRYRDMKYLNATEHMWPPYYWDEAFRGPPIELRKAVDSPVKFYSFNASNPRQIIAYRGSAWQNRGATFPQMLRNSTGGLLLNFDEKTGFGNCTLPHLCPDGYKNYPAGYVGGGGALGQIKPKLWLMDGSPFGRFSYNIPPTPHYMSPEGLLERWENPKYNVSALVQADDKLEAQGKERLWPDMKRWTQGGLTQSPYKFSTVERYCNHWRNKLKDPNVSWLDSIKEIENWEPDKPWEEFNKKNESIYDDTRKEMGYFGWLNGENDKKAGQPDMRNCRKAMLIRNRDLIEKFFIESQDPEDLMPNEYKNMKDFLFKLGDNLKRPRQDLKFGIRPATKKNLDCVFEINEDGDKAFYNSKTKFGNFFTYDSDRNRKIPKAARLVHHPIIQYRGDWETKETQVMAKFPDGHIREFERLFPDLNVYDVYFGYAKPNGWHAYWEHGMFDSSAARLGGKDSPQEMLKAGQIDKMYYRGLRARADRHRNSTILTNVLNNPSLNPAYTSPLHPPVREWEPRNQMVAPGDLNPYLKDKKINKELYPVINQNDIHNRKYMAQYYRLNYKSPLALGSYFKKNLSPKRRPNFVEMLFYDARYSKNKNIWQPDSFSNGLAYTANNMRGPKAWYDRTNGGNRFIYAYSAGCWTKLQPKDYGYDVPYSFFKLHGKKGENGEEGKTYWKDIVNEIQYFEDEQGNTIAQGVQAEKIRYYPEARDRVPGKELKERIIADPQRWRQNVLAAMADQKERSNNENPRDQLPKWQKNKTLKKWWQNQYGEQNYFSIQDAIKQQRCNGDEMQWYLFYSKPNYLDEFCTNTVFGNKIPKNFCKQNPPKYWNFTVTPKNSANFEKTLNDGSDFFLGWESREQSFKANPDAARKKIQDCIAKWDPAKMTNKLQFEGASENDYTLVGKMNRLQWMNWCVRPEKHKELFGLRWLFTGFGQWFDRAKAFTDGPFKAGTLCEAIGVCAKQEGRDQEEENNVTKKRSVTHEKNFFGGRNIQSESLQTETSSSKTPYLSSFIFFILISIL